MTTGTPTTASAGPGPVVAASIASTCAVTVLGALVAWPSPELTGSGWQVADVPPSTACLVAGAAVLCVVVAATLVRPGSLPGRAAAVTWWVLALASAFALTWNALYSAALSAVAFGAVIPVLHWLFTFVPALVVGLATRGAGPRAQLRATLGTAVVTLPLLALGWALLLSSDVLGAVLGTLWSTAVLGVVPLVVAVAATRLR
ncbi:hypothetical protein [Geodermatophilus sp. DSM 45219]|uniref:hypothetical protein n=1 Tax=Geodermatophilus sp. DSM 45219 TaxID=1881103 RepID=UPI00115FCE25|nr:hypothetical protein [Geodermatophilus sp. DSM 45219]